MPLTHNRVRALLKKYHADMDETVMKEVTRAMSDTYMMTFLAKEGPLGTAKIKNSSLCSKRVSTCKPHNIYCGKR